MTIEEENSIVSEIKQELDEVLLAISAPNSGLKDIKKKGSTLASIAGRYDGGEDLEAQQGMLRVAVGLSCLAQQAVTYNQGYANTILPWLQRYFKNVATSTISANKLAINFGAYKLAMSMNLSRFYLLQASKAEEGGDLDSAIESHRLAWKAFPTLEEAQKMLENGAQVEGVPVVGAPQEFPDQETYFVTQMGIPYRAMSTAAFEYARRLELQDPADPEIAELDVKALRIIEAGLEVFRKNGDLQTVAGVNLRLSACATFGASCIDDYAEQATIIQGNLDAIKRDTDALRELNKGDSKKGISEAKAIEWEMVRKSAELLLMQKQDIADEFEATELRGEILELGHTLGTLSDNVPPYIGINAVYKKALGNEFDALITSIEAGMVERRQEVIARLSTNPDGFEFKKT